MTWDVRDLRKNRDAVDPELLKELGGAAPEVTEKTPYNQLLDTAFDEQFYYDDAPLVQRVPQHMRNEFARFGLQTEAQWQYKKKLYTRGVVPDAGFDNPDLYKE